MNIGSGNGYPSSALSNFAPHKFILDGVECNSMEGFLQSLKFASIEMQVEVCKLVGYAAKKKGRNKNWYVTQTLYWRGVPYKRDNKDYQELLNKAYLSMFEQSESFRNALRAAGKDAVFTHTMGNTDPSKTVLTRSEFCKRLMSLKRGLF
jgi:predicted NAD-dependent protein-ADP-ribosyltransferase YbiA (DUF1768 family)